jgi:hypothetical protein
MVDGMMGFKGTLKSRRNPAVALGCLSSPGACSGSCQAFFLPDGGKFDVLILQDST